MVLNCTRTTVSLSIVSSKIGSNEPYNFQIKHHPIKKKCTRIKSEEYSQYLIFHMLVECMRERGSWGGVMDFEDGFIENGQVNIRD